MQQDNFTANNNDFLKEFVFNSDDFQLYDTSSTLADSIPESKPVGFFKDAMIRFSRSGLSLFSLFLILLIVFLAIFGPMMNEHHFRDQNVRWDRLPPRVPFLENFGIFDGSGTMVVQYANLPNFADYYIETIRLFEQAVPGRMVPMAEIRLDLYAFVGADDVYYWFGTDQLGRDLWTRLWRGSRVSLTVAVAAILVNLTIGLIYGAVAAYYGGKFDLIMVNFMEILDAIPSLVLMILIVSRLGITLWTLVIAFTVTGWLGMARMIRAQFYRFKGMEYVMAARVMGASDRRLIFRYILPNAIGPTITQVTVAVPLFIMAEAFLSYLGLGIQAPEPSVGVLLAQGQQMLFLSPHTVFFPGLVIAILMMGFNLMANCLRDAFDPTLRGHR